MPQHQPRTTIRMGAAHNDITMTLGSQRHNMPLPRSQGHLGQLADIVCVFQGIDRVADNVPFKYEPGSTPKTKKMMAAKEVVNQAVKDTGKRKRGRPRKNLAVLDIDLHPAHDPKHLFAGGM